MPLPPPVTVDQNQTGNVVQSFIDFDNVTAMEVHQTGSGKFTVTPNAVGGGGGAIARELPGGPAILTRTGGGGRNVGATTLKKRRPRKGSGTGKKRVARDNA